MTPRAAVLGHPISHSLSPALHNAAYAALGLDWVYEAIDVEESGLAEFLTGCGDEWGGLSLTMPLKLEGAKRAHAVEPLAKLVGNVNTLVPAGRGEYRQWVGANTDIHGIATALKEGGCESATSAVIIGAGATATSAVAALGQMGVTRPAVLVRSRARAGALLRSATRMGVSPVLLGLDEPDALRALAQAQAVVSTVPAEAGRELGRRLTESGVGVTGTLLDAIYHPLVTPLAQAWQAGGGAAISGTRMLLHQAGEQVRLMTGHEAPLGAMESVLTRMLNTS